MIDSKVMLAYVLNWLIIFVVIMVALLVGRDARKKGHSWTGTMVWVLVSICLFPIGVGLYFFLGRPQGRSHAADDQV